LRSGGRSSRPRTSARNRSTPSPQVRRAARPWPSARSPRRCSVAGRRWTRAFWDHAHSDDLLLDLAQRHRLVERPASLRTAVPAGTEAWLQPAARVRRYPSEAGGSISTVRRRQLMSGFPSTADIARTCGNSSSCQDRTYVAIAKKNAGSITRQLVGAARMTRLAAPRFASGSRAALAPPVALIKRASESSIPIVTPTATPRALGILGHANPSWCPTTSTAFNLPRGASGLSTGILGE
jgi:hypothetical protein